MFMRPVLERAQATGQQSSGTASIPAPLRGWNTRDPLAEMGELYAPVMDNWIPRETSCDLRKGFTTVATGFEASLGAFLPYNASNGTTKLFVAGNTKIYDVAVGAGAPVQSGLIGVGALWKSVNFSTTGGSFMLAANGADPVKSYDGTTWSNAAITGVTPSTLVNPIVYKRRIWFIQKGTMSVWVLPVNGIAGAATQLNIGPLFDKGGELIAHSAWTLDSGLGPDDYIAFLSSKGQVAVYFINDPATATEIQLRGLYNIPQPVGGQNAMLTYAGDLLVLTENGVYPMSKVVGQTLLNIKSSVTDAIAPSFRDPGRTYPTSTSWEMLVYTPDNLLIVNVPQSIGTVQFVANTITGAWCRFVGFNGIAWASWNRDLYFIKSGGVYKGLNGTSDGGANIVARAQQAHNYIGPRNDVRQKQLKMLRPQILTDAPFGMQLAVSMDFDPSPIFYYANLEALLQALNVGIWDTSLWDSATWGFSQFVTQEWKTVPAYPGFSASLGIQVASMLASIKWTATDLLFERGFVL